MTDINQVESDEQIINRLNERFDALSTLTNATAHGINRSLIVSGPAGIGKSECVERVLKSIPSRLSYSSVSGYCKATGLYKLLYENRSKGCTVLIDDCDSLLSDETAMNLFKAATDTKEVRKISWGSEAKLETESGEELPKSFEFEGNVIILTNIDLEDTAQSNTKYSVHIQAMLSRSMYLNLGFNSNRVFFLRIKQVVQNGMLTDKGIDYTVEQDLLHYIEINLDNLKELSLRMVIKLASLIKIDKKNWKQLARVACLK